MSSCTYLPKLKAEDNIKDHLTNLGAINPVTMEIYAPIDDFEKTLEKMTNDSNNSYFTNLKFFSVNPIQVKKAGVERNTTSRTDTTRTMYQLVTNSESFEQIDQIRNALGIYESQEAIGSYRKRKKLEIATEQAELQQRLDAARAGVGYTDEYLFSKDLAKIEFQDPTGEIKLTHDLKNTFRDPNIKDRFFPDSNDQTIKSVLDRIIKEGGSYADLAKHLKDLVVADIPVQLIELDFLVGMQNGKSFAAGGQYQPDYNNGRKKERIVIPEGAGHVNNDSAHTIMHEIIHALSWRTLENKHKYVVTEEVNAFKEAYSHAKTFFENNPQYKSKSEHFAYRLSDVHEFLTGMLTDPEFIRDLKNVPVSDSVNDIAKDWKSFFNEVIEKLLAMLGITPEKNFYNQASTVASHVFHMQNYVEDVNPMTEDEKDMYKKFEDERNIPLDFFTDDYGDAPFNKSEISTSVKEDLQELFESNPELVSTGTVEQYFQYLDTIFPDSKVKDIIVHLSRVSNIENFKINPNNQGNFINSQVLGSGVYFASPESIDYWSMELGFIDDETGAYAKNRNVYFAILNSKSPEEFQKNYIEDKDVKKDTDVVINQSRITGKREEYVVKDPNIIHILGSKQDIKGFEKFVNKPIVSDNQYNVQLNLQNLELTNEVIDYLYNVSSQRLSRESYGKEAYKLVTNLKGSLTKEEVVEKLKCL